jgi:valyl-tRNA synthetase
MLRKTTLFVPGFDHAKISTQSVVEKRLFKSGRTRHHLGRDKLFETVWDWKNVSVSIFCQRHIPDFFPDRRTYHQKTL